MVLLSVMGHCMRDIDSQKKKLAVQCIQWCVNGVWRCCKVLEPRGYFVYTNPMHHFLRRKVLSDEYYNNNTIILHVQCSCTIYSVNITEARVGVHTTIYYWCSLKGGYSSERYSLHTGRHQIKKIKINQNIFHLYLKKKKVNRGALLHFYGKTGKFII